MIKYVLLCNALLIEKREKFKPRYNLFFSTQFLPIGQRMRSSTTTDSILSPICGLLEFCCGNFFLWVPAHARAKIIGPPERYVRVGGFLSRPMAPMRCKYVLSFHNANTNIKNIRI